MSNIIPFNFEGMDVRITDVDGNPWFIAKDVCTILGYANSRKAVADHCKKAQKVGGNDSLLPQDIGRASFHESPHVVGERFVHPLDPQTTIIPEMDVYRLIMRSKLPDAERFQDWVVGEVLPSIRKTKSYDMTMRDKLESPDWLRGTLLKYTDRVIQLEREANENKPKLEAFERITASEETMCITDAAKILDMHPKALFDFLSYKKWTYKRTGCRHWVAYQDKIQQGLLEHKTTEVTRSDGSPKTAQQVRITQKGLSKLATMQGLQSLAIH